MRRIIAYRVRCITRLSARVGAPNTVLAETGEPAHVASRIAVADNMDADQRSTEKDRHSRPGRTSSQRFSVLGCSYPGPSQRRFNPARQQGHHVERALGQTRPHLPTCIRRPDLPAPLEGIRPHPIPGASISSVT